MTAFTTRLASTCLLALGTASPLWAQSIDCGGQAPGGQWIGGSEQASDIATAGAYQEQMALVLGGNTYASLFTLSTDAQVRIEAQGRGAGDPTVDLFDSDGNIVMSDDDSGGNGSARAEVDLAAGTYCVTTRSFDNAPMTAFVRIGLTDQEPLTEGLDMTLPPDGGDDMGQIEQGGVCDASTPAEPLAMGTAGTASVADVPFWRFTLTQATGVTVTAENDMADPYITIYDNGGNYIGENDDFDGLNSRIDVTEILEPGDYCISMQALSDTSAPITVSVSVYDAVAAQAALYDRGEAVPPLDGSYPVTALGQLDSRIRQDAAASDAAQWFSFEVPATGGLVLIEAASMDGTGDTYLRLFDDLGRLVSENDDNGNGLDSALFTRVSQGTYLVALSSLGDGSPAARLVFERYLPAK